MRISNRAWIVDLAMTVLLPLLMAYSLVGEALHEILGLTMFALFLAHQGLHWWYFRHYRAGLRLRHLPSNLINAALIALMAVLPVSGLAMSGTLAPWIPPLVGMQAMWMRIHMVSAYWAFTLMSVHAGMHAASAWKDINARFGEGSLGGTIRRISPIRLGAPVVAACVAWGAVRFFQRGFPAYLSASAGFGFLGSSLVEFLIDYSMIGCFLAALGWALHAGWEATTARPRQTQSKQAHPEQA